MWNLTGGEQLGPSADCWGWPEQGICRYLMINRGFEATRSDGICDVEALELVVEILGFDAVRNKGD